MLTHINSTFNIPCYFGVSNDTAIIRSQYNSSVLLMMSKNQGSSYTDSMSRIYSGITSIQTFSDRDKKKEIVYQTDTDREYCYEQI